MAAASSLNNPLSGFIATAAAGEAQRDAFYAGLVKSDLELIEADKGIGVLSEAEAKAKSAEILNELAKVEKY
jgi:hypothetical protein